MRYLVSIISMLVLFAKSFCIVSLIVRTRPLRGLREVFVGFLCS